MVKLDIRRDFSSSRMNHADFGSASLTLSLTFAPNLSIISLVIRKKPKGSEQWNAVRPNRSYRTDEKTARLVNRSERALVLGTREFARLPEKKKVARQLNATLPGCPYLISKQFDISSVVMHTSLTLAVFAS